MTIDLIVKDLNKFLDASLINIKNNIFDEVFTNQLNRIIEIINIINNSPKQNGAAINGISLIYIEVNSLNYIINTSNLVNGKIITTDVMHKIFIRINNLSSIFFQN